MATAAQLSLEQYLATSYRPDCNYVDGAIEERNLGDREHARLQMAIAAWFYSRVADLKLEVLLNKGCALRARECGFLTSA